MGSNHSSTCSGWTHELAYNFSLTDTLTASGASLTVERDFFLTLHSLVLKEKKHIVHESILMMTIIIIFLLTLFVWLFGGFGGQDKRTRNFVMSTTECGNALRFCVCVCFSFF